ncbi:putative virulence effector protein [Serratia proteamaculans]|uniref:SrfA family protein n=1 Tax=Serratia proteamaculans TaxID=28151 RepID=UPI0009F7A5EE|nr:SrfA family protein [Serratia proteamaculans]SMB28166.1 putative virulence effector protein [Serratia proteamaculans]
MVKPFLRSGSLDDVLALGENGQPVYACALQLRETLRIRQQQQAADCLAIPQSNETGTRIDWYSPFPGKVTSWLAASDAQRAQAVHLLEQSLATLRLLVAQTQTTEYPSHRLFGVLLAKAMQIPDANHVYLVDGKPVLTFWGFIKPQAQCQDDPLACLRPAENVEEKPTPIAAAPRPMALPTAKPAPEPEPEVKPSVATTPTQPRRQWQRYVWMLPVLMLIALLAGWLSRPSAPPAAPPVTQPLAPPPRTVTPVFKLQLPLAPATLMPPAPVPVVLPSADKHALVLPADSVKVGSTRFLNGKWRATVALKDLPTGKRPSLQYRINAGKGSASITYGDGISCRVPIEAGLMQSGNLVINSRTKARCSDGSRYQIPEIICKQNETGPAECVGRYDADTLYPMMLKRESK